MSKLFSQSTDMKKEYCCSVVKINEVVPIKGSDFLGTTLVDGFPVVVRKDQVSPGNVMFYVENECQIEHDFCYKNNLFEDRSMNEDQEKKGFFNKHGRVRIVKLRGQESMGYLFTASEMATYLGNVKEKDIIAEMRVGDEFDTVNGKLFVKAYVPETKENKHHTGKGKKFELKLFVRTIPNEMLRHYDSDQFEKGVYRFKPSDYVTISVKLHGQSGIFGNVLVKMPKYRGLYTKYFMYLPKFMRKTKETYDYLYSSRNIIRNDKVLEKPVKDGKYGSNFWGKYNDLFKKYDVLSEGMTLYGEIVGFTDEGTAMQRVGGAYDYGCGPKENQLMVYRISYKSSNGTRFEWNVDEVFEWTKKVMDSYPEIAPHLHPIDILYSGTLKDLYPDIVESDEFKAKLTERPEVEGESEEAREYRLNFNKSLKNEKDMLEDYLSVGKTIWDLLDSLAESEEHSVMLRAWQECVLTRMKTDKNFGMEGTEPLCKNKVFREGIVIRKHNDPLTEAFKLKCSAFRNAEAKKVDAGEVDAEMAESYT